MICANCGGEINIHESCGKCGISYSEMIENISHEEMKRLLERMKDMMDHHKSIGLEKSLLACELLNSSFLVPIDFEGDNMKIGTAENMMGKNYILLFTDKCEYDKCNLKMDPRTNPFNKVLELLDDGYSGFVINYNGISCTLSKKFLDDFFGGE